MQPYPSQSSSPSLVLAPMEGVMDAPMRTFFSERGGIDYCVSEFLRVSHQELPKSVFLRDVPELRSGGLTPSGIPVQIQLLGGNEEMMSKSALHAVELGALGIDINFGCPSPQVNRNDGGASLLRFPERIESVIAAVRSAVPASIPVSAKLRLGWDNREDIFENARRAVNGGASWITIHARTKVQGYAPPVSWIHIGRVRAELGKFPVIANGDIWTFEDFLRCQKESQCNHFMLGRGILSNPSLVQKIREHLFPSEGVKSGQPPDKWMDLLKRFTEINRAYLISDLTIVRRIKQWLRYANLHQTLPWFDTLKRSETLNEIFSIVENT